MKELRATVLFLFIVFFSARLVKAQSFTWANSSGGSGADYGNSVAVDGSGNVYVAGYFNSATISFGSIMLTNSNDGTADIFFVKYDGNGNVLWAQSAGGLGNDCARSIAIDASGNVYVAGDFRSPEIAFGSEVLTNADPDGSTDICLVKCDADGNVLWAQRAGGSPGNDYGNSVAVDASGNAYVTGYFNSAALEFGSATITNAGFIDTYLVKYDPDGNAIWANSAGGTGSDFGKSVAIDASGNAYVTGNFNSPTMTSGATTLTKIGTDATSDIFLLKYDKDGNCFWAQSAGGTANDQAESVAADVFGNVYVAGCFFSVMFNAGSATQRNTGYAGSSDIFLLKYDKDGNPLMIQKPDGPEADYCSSVATDASGNVYLAGYFYDYWIQFGTTVFNKASNDGTTDMFLAKYDASGKILWAKSAVGIGTDFAKAVTADASGNVYVTGSSNSAPFTFGSTTLGNAGEQDVFIAKLLPESGELPVELTSFSTARNGRDIQLRWNTASEINNYGFEVERRSSSLTIPLSGGGQSGEWTKIGFVRGNGTTNAPKEYVYIDKNCPAGKYSYRLKQIDNGGAFKYSGETSAVIEMPRVFALTQNYPNPFNPSTTISFTLAEDSRVSLKVFDIMGREVATLVNGNLKAGELHSAVFDASHLASGMYLYRLEAGKNSLVKKLLLMK